MTPLAPSANSRGTSSNAEHVTFLAMLGSYNSVECALFRGKNLLYKKTTTKAKASQELVSMIDELLSSEALVLSDLKFIAVNRGPGPFTTLRTVITTANGVAFSSGIPMVGINGIDALVDEAKNEAYDINVAILNAFNNDTYYTIDEQNSDRVYGCEKISEFVERLNNYISDGKTINLFGNGITTFEEELKGQLSEKTNMDQNCMAPSIEQIGLAGLKSWLADGKTTDQIVPIYMKTQNFKVNGGS